MQVLPGERPVIAPCFGERAVEKRTVDQQHEQGDEHGQGKKSPLDPLGNREGIEGDLLAGDGHIGPAAHPEPVYQEQHNGGDQQRYCQHGSGAHVIPAVDLHVCLRGQQSQITADHDGVAEIRQHVDGGDQGAAGHAGAAQGPEYVPEYRPAGGAHVVGCVFEVGGDAPDHAIDNRVGVGKKRHGLNDPKAKPPIDVYMQTQKPLGDDTLHAEEQNVAQGHDEGRGDDGQQRNEPEKLFAGHVQTGDHIGKQKGNRRAGERGDQSHEEAVFDGGEPAGASEQLCIGGHVREQDDLYHRVDHKQPYKCDDAYDGHQQKRLVFQPLHLLDGLPGGCCSRHGGTPPSVFDAD